MKIIFMGTPEFSCPTLEKLIKNPEFEIVAVYTREPQISGRGHKLQNSPIHELAIKNNLPIITPKTLKDNQVKQEFLNLNADAAAVVAYGLILPKEIIEGTKYGCFNIHPSILPKWRGAAPIQRAIMAGDKETAIDIIKMDEGLDSGDIIVEEKIKLDGTETYAKLAPELAEQGAKLMIEALKKISDGETEFKKQNDDLATYAKKIEKSECKINWNLAAEEIERKIRALNGNLGAFFNYDEEKIKIYSAEIIDRNSVKFEAGKILDENFSIQCAQGVIRPIILQRQGKKPMQLKEILCGFKPKVGKVLS